ncbi:hypothetical protein D9611_013243 [Ephemerocybe angulata]|uniref:Glucose receptor Git3 N-terminal domain-containing protein n=1 Tax=Ephemerocybe angulata TaxID=980116 RepID=A0A8H5CAZ1_9AGAR|nr:hypothetical protein D9611_013243 [Tulosesus angulatus]
MEFPPSPAQSCTNEEYQRVLNGDRSLHCLTRGQSIGLSVVVESGLVSLIAVLFVFGIIIRNVFRRVRRQRKWQVFVDPIDIIMSSLFLGDAFQALGAVVNIKWVAQGKVEVGGFCTAQGIIQQLGETTVAMSTLLIAIYTFRGLWLGKTVESLRVTKFVTLGIWLFVSLMILLGNVLNRNKDSQHRYETPTPYWCWIGKDYLQWKIWGEYFWFWLTLAVSLCTYIPLFFWSRGNISINPKSGWKFTFHRTNKTNIPAEFREQSLIMLAYPVVYCIAILPLSVARWIGFFQERNGGVSTIPSSATFACVAILSISGACNVLLLLTTRPDTVLFGRGTDRDGMAPAPGLPDVQQDVHHQQHEVHHMAERSTSKTVDSDTESVGRLPA